MESMQSKETGFKKWGAVFLRAIIAGGLAAGIAYILYLLAVQWSLPTIYQFLIPISLSVTIALYLTYGWKKGFKKLDRSDYVSCLSGGVRALIAEVIIYFFLI